VPSWWPHTTRVLGKPPPSGDIADHYTHIDDQMIKEMLV
jgi:hypothetical protein